MVTNHYNYDERMVPLMDRVSCQFIQKVWEHVNVVIISKGVGLTVVLNYVSKSRNLMEVCKMTHIEVWARNNQYGPGQIMWEFDWYHLFANMDHTTSMCSDPQNAIVLMDQLRRLTNISDVTDDGKGGYIKSGVEIVAVAEIVNSLPGSLEPV